MTRSTARSWSRVSSSAGAGTGTGAGARPANHPSIGDREATTSVGWSNPARTRASRADAEQPARLRSSTLGMAPAPAPASVPGSTSAPEQAPSVSARSVSGPSGLPSASRGSADANTLIIAACAGLDSASRRAIPAGSPADGATWNALTRRARTFGRSHSVSTSTNPARVSAATWRDTVVTSKAAAISSRAALPPHSAR